MRSVAIMGLVLLVFCPAFGQTTDRLRSQPPGLASDTLPPQPMRHHQPSQAEVDERESGRLAVGDRGETARSAASGNGQTQARFLAACMARVHLDEPLGSEEKHRRFCSCRLDALKASVTPEELEAVALDIEERNAGNPYVDLPPAKANRSNQAAILACMNELAP